MSCNMRPEDYPYIATIGKSTVKHYAMETRHGSIHTACRMFVSKDHLSEIGRWNLTKAKALDVTCKHCIRIMGLVENERRDGIDNDDTVFVIREKDSGYFFKSGDGRHWVKQINKASTFSSINSDAIKRHVGELHYFKGDSEISRAVYWSTSGFTRSRDGYREEYVIDSEKYEVVPVKLEVVSSNNALNINQKAETDLSKHFKYDIGDVVIVKSRSSLTYSEREITARSLNFFTGGFEVIYTAKHTFASKFYKVDQCDIIGVKE